ncbi:xanthine/CO dehydrogenase XdhC/CoxF family maturation factor [Actinoplanes campanulatus]|uniref:Xanthine/CO dehydrogenase XdhC/CoxF family maturation factor n=1 Tax=Actinoplanes campanulatus TaxID=113559 RepID=A0A7W5AQW8_9ACTN|nr:XdhC family protein [Actinoplanes campanulatus]MBB3100174.1 xanthine/CO dehydrogenase XdhC/CoxF family maturation factor [Actinoplanes campanulatus]
MENGAQSPRRLIAVFESPVSEMLFRFGVELGFQTVLVEPDPTRLGGTPRPHGDTYVSDLSAAAPDEHTDILLTDHHRPEIGALLREALDGKARWIGILGNPRHEGPHVAALRELGVPEEEIGRVHRPVGLNIGSRTPAEIAVATLAGLIADRNGRPGGFEF